MLRFLEQSLIDFGRCVLRVKVAVPRYELDLKCLPFFVGHKAEGGMVAEFLQYSVSLLRRERHDVLVQSCSFVPCLERIGRMWNGDVVLEGIRTSSADNDG